MTNQELISQISQLNPALASAIQQSPLVLPLLILELILKLIFYPIALYTAGKNTQKAWFVVLFICFLLLNDMAILPILYLIFNRRMLKQNQLNSKISSKKKKL
jgi:hypothetical protein